MDLKKEKELIIRAKEDPEAFGELFDSYYPKILNFAVRRVGDIDAAKDVTSVVFIKVFKNIKKFKWIDVSFSSWVYRIATNETNDYFRRGKRAYTQSLDTLMNKYGFELLDSVNIEEELIAAEEEIEKRQLFVLVQKELRQLEIKYQEVLALKFFEHKTTKEIAVILSKKEGTVKSLISRGLSKLRINLVSPAQNKGMTVKMQPIETLSVLKVEGK